MRRSILAMLLAAVMLLCLTPFASAAGAAFVVEVPVSSAAAGESFEVTVSLRDNPGFYAMEFNLVYDEDALECTKVTAGPIAKQMLYVTNPKGRHGAVVVGATAEAIEEDGVIAVFSFTAKKSVSALSFKTYNCNISDVEGQEIETTVVWNGTGGTEEPPEPTAPDEPEPTTPPEPSPTTTPTPALPPTTPPEGGDPIPGQEETSAPSFSDVAGHWGEASVLEAAKRGLFNGYPDGRFGPDDNVTRAQFVTVLYRMSGSPETSAQTPFEDIGTLSAEFRRAVAWAYENGYVNGKADTVFDPSGFLTRQEALKILFYYSGGQSGMELMLYSTYDEAYADSGDIASWAKPAMYWGVYKGIISGTSEDTLSPQGTATRAQLAKILVNYLDKFQ